MKSAVIKELQLFQTEKCRSHTNLPKLQASGIEHLACKSTAFPEILVFQNRTRYIADILRLCCTVCVTRTGCIQNAVGEGFC
jgi:hypothetical protein